MGKGDRVEGGFFGLCGLAAIEVGNFGVGNHNGVNLSMHGSGGSTGTVWFGEERY